MSNSSSTSLSQLQAEVDQLRHELALKDNANAKDEQISIGNYILNRIAQLGVTKIFGVPGDFNLGFLDLVEDFKDVDWIGNCNELGAAYAADGYARVKEKSIGVLITTFGVGELSAINGVAGAFSEHVPVLHIVGVPSTTQLKNKPLLHHTLGDGRFDAYTKAAEQFTISHTTLMDKRTAAAEIDRVLHDCITVARPVYLMLPTDMFWVKISSSPLKVPISRIPPPNDEEIENFVLDEIEKLVDQADGDVVVLVDACARRHHVLEEVKELLHMTGFPVYAAPMGKTAIDEDYERYGGIYIGSLTPENIKSKIETAKCIISVGALRSDFNTGNFTYRIPMARTVELHSDHTQVQYAKFQDIGMKRLLPKLSQRLSKLKPNAHKLSVPKYKLELPREETETITHKWLWPRVGQFFKPKDVIVTETGTSNFGILDIPLPKDSVLVNQVLWGSIGWATGGALGAAFAARDLDFGRTILFIGDGSLQLTVQELSSMVRYGLKPILFVLNNSGYTIERHLNGLHRKYNDIQNWSWTKLLAVFGGEEGRTCQSYLVQTKQELSNLLDDASFAAADKIQLVEIRMEMLDAPHILLEQTKLSGKTNSYIEVV